MRERVPGVAVRTSFIVGFPGETEAEFAELLAFVQAGEFDNVGVFTFSDEEGTASFDLGGRVPARDQGAARNKLMSLQKKIAARKNRDRVGERLEVLVEGAHPDSELLLRGRLASQAPDIDGSVMITDSAERFLAPGDFVTCEITKAHPYDLEARVV